MTEALATQKDAVASQATTVGSTFGTLEGFKADDTRGKEGIDSGDMRLPFLSLAQKTSKAVDPTEDAYIDGLTFGDMYNSETKEVYGKQPLTFIPLRHSKRAYLPDENGRMGEEIGWGDKRCEWPTEEEKKNWTGKGKPKPAGVRVYDWVVLLKIGGELQLAVISFKSKSFGAGQSLATFVNMVAGAAFTAQYKIASVLENNDAGKYAKFAVAPAGKPTLAEAKTADEWYTRLEGKTIATEELEPEPGSADGPAKVVDGTVVEGKIADDKIPF